MPIKKRTSRKRVSPKRASAKRVSGKRVSGKRASGKRVSGKRVSGKRVSGKRVSGKRVSGKRASGKRASAKRVSGKRASGKRAYKKKNQKGGIMPISELSGTQFVRSNVRRSLQNVQNSQKQQVGRGKCSSNQVGGFFEWFFGMFGGGTSPSDTCVICTESGPTEEGEEQVEICPRGHYAHPSCVRPWYSKNKTCPECRIDVSDTKLWKEINKIKEIDDPMRYAEVFENILESDDADDALQFMNSDEGIAYIKMVTKAAQENPDYGFVIETILRKKAYDVAEVFQRVFENFWDDIDIMEGTDNIMKKFYDDWEALNWLNTNDYAFDVSLLKEAIKNNSQRGVMWYHLNTNDLTGQTLTDAINMARDLGHTQIYNMLLSFK